MIAGYEPERIAGLRWRTMASIGALDAIASRDPASDTAMMQVRTLRRVLDIDVMGALNAIHDRDPLVGDVHRRGILDPGGHVSSDRSRWQRIIDDVFGRTDPPDSTQFSEHTLFDLAMLLRLELTRQVDDHGMPDFDDPFWTDEFPGLVTEFERRAATDPAFGEWLVEQARDNPLVGLIIADSDVDGELIAAVAAAIIQAPPAGQVRDAYRSEAVIALLEQVAADPVLALDLLDDPAIVEALYTWNDDAFLVTKIPDELLADLIVSGIVIAPEIDDDLHATAYRALGNFVGIADEWFDDGFDPAVAVALALAAGAHAAAFLESSDGYCTFDLRDNGVVVDIGTRADLIEFFGALLHDPTSQAVLTAVMHDLAASAEPGGGITPEEVSAFTVLLDDALDNEHLELRADAAGTVSQIGFATTVANFVAGQILNGTGVGVVAKFLVSLGIKHVGQRAGDSIEPDTLGIVDFDVLGDLVIELELIRDALAPGSTQRTSASANGLSDAREALDAVDALFADDGSTFAEIETAMRDLRSATEGVIEPIEFTRYVPRVLDDASHPCDPANGVPTYGR